MSYIYIYIILFVTRKPSVLTGVQRSPKPVRSPFHLLLHRYMLHKTVGRCRISPIGVHIRVFTGRMTETNRACDGCT